jgi:GntR family transcriptional regulator
MIVRENLVDQAKKHILEYIFKENLSKGDKLPSIEQLASIFSVGRSTIREAIRSLEQLHILETVQGKGTFVTVDPSSLGRDISQLRSVTEMAQESGITLVNFWVSREEILADDFLAQKLEVEVGTPLVSLQRIRGFEGEAIVYLEDILPKKYTLTFSEEDWNGSLFQALEKSGVKVVFSWAKIIPYIPDSVFLKKMGLKQRVPFLLLQHLHYDARGRVIAFSKDYYHSEFFHFEVLRRRL